jgi:hypothetical protein
VATPSTGLRSPLIQRREGTSTRREGLQQRTRCKRVRQWRSMAIVKFVETTAFTRKITEVMTDDEYRLLQEVLLRRPAQGSVIEGSGGVRKLRWAEKGRGKRGGLRIIYYWHTERELFLMLYAYRKSEQKDLTREQRKLLAKLVQQEFK